MQNKWLMSYFSEKGRNPVLLHAFQKAMGTYGILKQQKRTVISAV
jgi:hypothetical protein